MDRRKFIQNSALIAGTTVLSPNFVFSSAIEKTTKLTILHTNDTHSNIESFPSNHAKYPDKGGVSRRYDLIRKIREEEENVLLLDAGDIFQGTPYFNRFGGVLEMKLMTMLGYDAATMGNHDFDGGMDGFLKAKQYADFPFLCSNYDFQNTVLDGHTKKYQIFRKGRLRIGVFGVGVEPKGLIPDVLYKETRYINPVETAQDMVKILRKEGADLIICLSHLGYQYDTDKISDIRLARETEGIHLIVGGHTHTFLDRPTVEINKKGEPVLINQVGWAGLQLGRIDFYIGRTIKNNSQIVVVE